MAQNEKREDWARDIAKVACKGTNSPVGAPSPGDRINEAFWYACNSVARYSRETTVVEMMEIREEITRICNREWMDWMTKQVGYVQGEIDEENRS